MDSGKYYFAMRIRYDEAKAHTLSCLDKKYGPKLILKGHALLPQYLMWEKAKYEKILKNVDGDTKSRIIEEIGDIDKLLGRMYGKS